MSECFKSNDFLWHWLSRVISENESATVQLMYAHLWIPQGCFYVRLWQHRLICTSAAHREMVYYTLNSCNTSESTLINIIIFILNFLRHTRGAENKNDTAQRTNCQMLLRMAHQACQEPTEIFWCQKSYLLRECMQHNSNLCENGTNWSQFSLSLWQMASCSFPRRGLSEAFYLLISYQHCEV